MHARVLGRLLLAFAVTSGASLQLLSSNYEVSCAYVKKVCDINIPWKCSFRETEPRMGCILMVVFNGYSLIP